MSSLVSFAITVLSVLLPSVLSNEPTNVNKSGEYYVASDYITDFSYSSIQCQYKSHCYVICDSNQGCHLTTIKASSAKSLTIECRDTYSCSKLKLLQAPSESLSIKCTGDNACNEALFSANDTTNVDINCLNNNINAFTTNSALNPCYATTFYVENADTVNIACNGDSTCYLMNVYANKARSLSITVDGSYALYQSNIHAYHANKMHLFCGYDHTSCYQNHLYFPSSFALSCYARGCEELGHLYVLTSITSIDMDYNGCGECYSSSNCAPESTTIHCGPYGDADYFSYGTCNSNICGCNTLQTAMYNNYYTNSSSCADINHWDASVIIAAVTGWVIFCSIIYVLCCACCGIGLYYMCCKPKRYRGPHAGTAYIPVNQMQQQQVMQQPNVVVMNPQNVAMQPVASPYAPPLNTVSMQQEALPPYAAAVNVAPSAPQEGVAGNHVFVSTNQM